MNRLLQYFSSPKNALVGSLVLAGLWLVFGLSSQYFFAPEADQNSESFLPWKNDVLGHFLILVSVCAAAVFLTIDPLLRRRIKGFGAQLESKKQFLKKWTLATLAVNLLMTAANFNHVANIEGQAHWAQNMVPYLLPLAIATTYYIFTLTPLFISLVSLSWDILQSARKPRDIDGFDPFDKQFCFGISGVGNALILSVFFILLFLIPGFIIQCTLKNNIGIGSIAMIPFCLFVIFQTGFLPATVLYQELAEIKHEEVKAQRKKVDKLSENVAGNSSLEAALENEKEKLDTVSSQKLLPFSKPFSALGIASVTVSTVAAIIKGLKEAGLIGS